MLGLNLLKLEFGKINYNTFSITRCVWNNVSISKYIWKYKFL